MAHLDLQDKDPNFFRQLRHACEQDPTVFARVFFRVRMGTRLQYNWHIGTINRLLERTIEQKCSRVIITIPPGYLKTELMIQYMARGLALNRHSQFLHTSYSGDLALRNSSAVRDIVNSWLYQRLWPRKLRTDTQAKKRWYIEDGGGVYAAASGGQITGFRAGQLSDEFSGAVVIDDPIKIDDAHSAILRARIIDRFSETLRSRLAHKGVPIILIMQRVHEDDLAGFLLRGGSGERWEHLSIPVEQDNADYPVEYTYSDPIKYRRPTELLWERKDDQGFIDSLKKDIYIYATQYQQRPAPKGGSVFKDEWWQHYKSYDPLRNEITLLDDSKVKVEYKCVYADTAMKTGELNDWSVFELWLKGLDGRIYLGDLARGKWESPQLKNEFKAFTGRHEFIQGVNSMGLRDVKVEDKASGIGLIQDINQERGYDYITGIPRDKDKVSRARSGAPKIADGLTVLPVAAPWLAEYKLEFSKFTAIMSHKHDDQIDPTLDAIHDMLIESSELDYGRAL